MAVPATINRIPIWLKKIKITQAIQKGKMQYPSTQMDWNNDLKTNGMRKIREIRYIFPFRSLAFSVMITEPNQMIINTVEKITLVFCPGGPKMLLILVWFRKRRNIELRCEKDAK